MQCSPADSRSRATRIVVACVMLLAGCDRHHRDEPRAPPSGALPSRRDLGPYPLIVPLDWQAIGANGEPESIPRIPGRTVHRILIRGAALLTEPPRAGGELPEAVMVESVADFGLITEASLEAFAHERLATVARAGFEPRLTEHRVLHSQLGSDPVGKLVIVRNAETDHRIEVDYVVRDRGHVWQIGYLIRPSDVERWRPWFAEMESETRSP